MSSCTTMSRLESKDSKSCDECYTAATDFRLVFIKITVMCKCGRYCNDLPTGNGTSEI